MVILRVRGLRQEDVKFGAVGFLVRPVREGRRKFHKHL